MSELKPCPFCGGEAGTSAERFERTLLSWVFCKSCGAAGGYRHTEVEAIDAWNTRTERTCEFELTELSSGSAYHDVWLCGGCGEQVERHTVMGKSEPPNYCPNCGAKVVDE